MAHSPRAKLNEYELTKAYPLPSLKEPAGCLVVVRGAYDGDPTLGGPAETLPHPARAPRDIPRASYGCLSDIGR